MLILKVCADIFPDKRQEFLQAIEAMLGRSQAHGEWISRTLYEQRGRHNAFCYLEEWTSREPMEAHFKTDRFQALVGAMELLGEIQDFKIITSARIEGLETLDML